MDDPLSENEERARLLFWVGVAGAVLFVGTIAGVVLVNSILFPILSAILDRPITPVGLDPVLAGLMLTWTLVALGLAPAAAFLRRTNGTNGGEE